MSKWKKTQVICRIFNFGKMFGKKLKIFAESLTLAKCLKMRQSPHPMLSAYESKLNV